MKILIIDPEKVGLPFALRCQEAGHHVKLWTVGKAGIGMVDRCPNWKTHMNWADLIFMTDNAKLREELAPYFTKGYPIFGPNKKGGDLELDREVGQKLLENCGIKTLDYKTFTDYRKAIEYVKKEGKPFVSKPWGGEADKDLSYVPKTPEDLICRLERWIKDGKKDEILLQEMIKGYEMAVGGWFGPGGWAPYINENWEEKRMLCGGLGPNTGEMGTVMRYVEKSQMFDDVLAPVTDYLKKIKYVGYVDMNCMVGEDGTPWPLEFTTRPGWPHFNIACSLHIGDPATWMYDMLEGRNTLKCSKDVAVGVVMAQGDYPWNKQPESDHVGWPIRGLNQTTLHNVWLNDVMMGPAPVKRGKEIVTEETHVTTGTYVAIVTGHGDTVKDAQKSANDTCKKIWWPRHKTMRLDIGDRLEEDLEHLQEFGYAEGLQYGSC